MRAMQRPGTKQASVPEMEAASEANGHAQVVGVVTLQVALSLIMVLIPIVAVFRAMRCVLLCFKRRGDVCLPVQGLSARECRGICRSDRV
jgi:hypothetical protein